MVKYRAAPDRNDPGYVAVSVKRRGRWDQLNGEFTGTPRADWCMIVILDHYFGHHPAELAMTPYQTATSASSGLASRLVDKLGVRELRTWHVTSAQIEDFLLDKYRPLISEARRAKRALA